MAVPRDDSPDKSSPTPTVRQVSPASPPLPLHSDTISPVVITTALPRTATAPDQPTTNRSRPQQQAIGRGHPRGPSVDIARPSHIVIQESPVSPQPPGIVISGRAASVRSFIASDDDDDAESRGLPRTAAYFPTDQTPRVSGMQKPPYTAAGSTFTSPAGHGQISSGSGSAATYGRPSRPKLTTHITGAGSRSASRARPNASHAVSGVSVNVEQDDEVKVLDRGEDLIRRRMIERKRAKRERELRLVAGEEDSSKGPPTPVAGDTFGSASAMTGRTSTMGAATGRGVSRSRQTSAVDRRSSDDRRYFSAGGYFAPRASSVASDIDFREPSGFTARERPESLLSTPLDDEDLERAPSLIDEVVAGIVEEESTAAKDAEDVDDDDEDQEGGEEGDDDAEDDEGVTLKDRQDAINIEHPFGLPIWKPALYRKSRSVTRNAESALHLLPSAVAERHLLVGNILWVIIFSWWLALVCFIVALVVSATELLCCGHGGYGKTLRGLAWYIAWPFGKYVEGEGPPDNVTDDAATGTGNGDYENNRSLDEENSLNGYGTYDTNTPHGHSRREVSDSASSAITVRAAAKTAWRQAESDPEGLPDEPTTPSQSTHRREPTVSFAPSVKISHGSNLWQSDEHEPLLPKLPGGNTNTFRHPVDRRATIMGSIVYWPGFVLVVAPVMLIVCILCWGLIVTIPMAKLTWALLNLLWNRPLEINFLSAPMLPVPSPDMEPTQTEVDGVTPELSREAATSSTTFTLKAPRLHAGQIAPTAGPTSTILLCTYRAVGLQYYKYTIGGVNIMFINLLPLVFFTIIDGLLLLPAVERAHHAGHTVSPLLTLVTSPALIFVLALASVIPLSYFIGMAVASISAQSSIGMGAVINATFGSVIEVILYGIALTQGKGRLVEGSIVGSILAGVLLMPGSSMCSGALKRKEQKFNAKSAGVTSTMLIMAIIGTLTPTMFYQTYGSFQLHCEGCPEPNHGGSLDPSDTWQCNHCYYEHPEPTTDPFYQEQVKTLMYSCAAILLLSYLIGLWFSLRTHASQIWQNPQQLLAREELNRSNVYQRLPQGVINPILPVHHHKPNPSTSSIGDLISPSVRGGYHFSGETGQTALLSPTVPTSPTTLRHTFQPLAPADLNGMGQSHGSSTNTSRVTSNNYDLPAGYTPFLESVDRDMKGTSLEPMHLPSAITAEDFTRAVALATVSALRHHRSLTVTGHPVSGSGSGVIGAPKLRPASGLEPIAEDHEVGGHEAPSWTRGVSAGVLLACTLLYAIIAEILVDVVDVVLQGSGVDEKFLGLTLFALVPNTTEFMNAVSFAMNGNIALSMEIGSAYALQVCLLQIPAMVAFSALYNPSKVGDAVDTFTLIFPRWDVIAIILSIFLITYTYIEARSNYHRGSILILAYIVLVMGFYYAPARSPVTDEPGVVVGDLSLASVAASMAEWTKLWA